ncbi:MAG: glycerol-3-phosphate dehydrogenase, partial [Acidiphilium sp. 21-66-27]
MTQHPEFVVIGAGAWGAALATLYAAQGRRVTLVARDTAKAASLAATRTTPHLPNLRLPDNLAIAERPPEAPVTLLAVPFQHLRETLGRLPQGNGTLVLCAKGVERETGALGPEIAAEMEPRRPCAVLTGPNFAHEIAAGLPAATVLAMTDVASRRDLVQRLATPRLRVYGSADPIGAALGGAAKNVIAIAAGAVIGAGLGENARA